MKEVIIFGGSFNPPTLGHVEIMKHCLEQPAIDEVWIMPSGRRMDKEFTTTDTQRLEMLEHVKAEAFGGDSRIKVSDFEMRLPAPTETYRTLGALAGEFPSTKFWFTFGVDAYRNLAKWNHGEWMQRELSMYVVPRDGELPPDAPNIRLLPPVRDVSSTLAREAVACNQPLELFVPRAITNYIFAERLYA